MTGKKKLPIGIDIFEKLDREEFYYVDKTGMIEDLIQNRSEVNLFTRPRRFGKSLNMSTMKAFFEIGASPALFKGLKISERKELCEKYMGQFPVISISLKSVEGLSFTAAGDALKTVIGTEAFCEAFLEQNPEKIEEIFSDYLWNTISIRDTASSKKENFYHGILLGLLGYKFNWLVKSNAESGFGYSDILVEVPKNRTGIVIELKYAEDGNMDAACEKALQQIEDRDYAAKLKDDGILTERMFFPVDVIVKSVSKRTFESTVFLEAFFIDHDLPSGTAGIGTGTCDTGKFFIKSRFCYLHVLFSLTLCAIMFSKSITFCSVNYNERSHSWSNI